MFYRLVCLALLFVVGGAVNNSAFAQKLYLFSEGDVHDSNVGECVQTGIEKVALSLKENMPSDRFVLYNDPDDSSSWTGPDISRSRDVRNDILNAIDRCPAGSNDTIFFYWCGHGAFDEGSHFLWMPENRGDRAMRRTEILSALKNKNPRLIVFITESCHVLQSFPARSEAPGSPVQTELSPLFQSLFFDCNGIVNANSSSPGQFSRADKNVGGLFTFCLCSIFQNDGNHIMSWKNVFDSIDSQIEVIGSSNNQTVYAWALPDQPVKGEEWSAPIYHPENGDRIIAVNSKKVSDFSDYKFLIENSVPKVVLTLIDVRSNNRYYLLTTLLPKGSRSRLGIYVKDDDRGGVIVTGVMRNMPGNRCRYLNNGDTTPIGGRDTSGWTGPTYRPDIGDRIIEVNGQFIDDEADFRRAVANSPQIITLTIIEHGSHRCWLRTQLRPKGYQTRLGIYVETSSSGGVSVTGIMPGTPGMHCQYKSE